MRNSGALILMLALSGLGTTSCQGPCRTLAEQVCRCSDSPREQQACEVRVDANARGQTITDEEAERCEALLDVCTCEALQQGERAACGLSELPDDVDPRSASGGAEPAEEDFEG